MKSEEFSLSNFSKRHVNFFKKEGYIVAKNIINVKDIQSLRKSIFTVLEKILKSQKINIKINIKNIDKEMILLRQKNPNLFAKFFDTLQTLSSIYLTVSSNKIINVASKLLKVKNYQTTLTDVGVRLDVPNDNKNTLGWHQDTSYYRQNNFGKNGLVLWVPIFKINKNMGSLQHLRFSHNLGPLNIKKSKKSSAFASSKREINSKKLIKYKQIL